jgi:hypothetical protein
MLVHPTALPGADRAAPSIRAQRRDRLSGKANPLSCCTADPSLLHSRAPGSAPRLHPQPAQVFESSRHSGSNQLSARMWSSGSPEAINNFESFLGSGDFAGALLRTLGGPSHSATSEDLRVSSIGCQVRQFTRRSIDCAAVGCQTRSGNSCRATPSQSAALSDAWRRSGCGAPRQSECVPVQILRQMRYERQLWTFCSGQPGDTSNLRADSTRCIGRFAIPRQLHPVDSRRLRTAALSDAPAQTDYSRRYSPQARSLLGNSAAGGAAYAGRNGFPA